MLNFLLLGRILLIMSMFVIVMTDIMISYHDVYQTSKTSITNCRKKINKKMNDFAGHMVQGNGQMRE